MALRVLFVVVVLAGLGAVNVVTLSEAYGDGPPYYGRTTNMDKWSSPWPLLAPVDLLGLLAVGLVARGRRSART